MADESKSGIPVAEKTESPVDRLFGRATRWVADNTAVDEQTHELLNLIATNNSAKLRMVENVVAMKKVERLYRLHEASDLIDSRVLHPITINAIKDPRILIQLAQLVKDAIQADAAYVQRIAHGGVDPVLKTLLHQMDVERDEQSADMVETLKEITPQKREVMRRVMDKVREDRAAG